VDLQNVNVGLSAKSVKVDGVQRESKNVYKVDLELYDEINVEVLIPLFVGSVSILFAMLAVWIRRFSLNFAIIFADRS
jgi:hypothetical protein